MKILSNLTWFDMFTFFLAVAMAIATGAKSVGASQVMTVALVMCAVFAVLVTVALVFKI